MAEIIVELDAWVLPDDHRVFKFSAGKTYRFYRAVEDANAAFLDVRGLDQLPRNPKEWNERQVLEVIAADRWSRELQSRQRGNKEKGTSGIGPQDRKVLTFLKRLIFEARDGDLLVIPPHDYTKGVLIGEVMGDPGELRSVIARDGEETHTYLGRPVKWRGSFEKRFASADLLEKLHNPNAMFILGRELRHEIYRWAYGDYVADGQFVASFHTTKPRFTSEDSAVVSAWFNGLDVLRYSLNTNTPLPASFYQMGLAQRPDDGAADLKININSPGSFDLRSKDGFALAAMVLFALAGCDSKEVVQDHITVHLKTVGAATQGCKHVIEDTVNAMAKGLGPKRLEEQCELIDRAAQSAQIRTGARLKSGPRKST